MQELPDIFPEEEDWDEEWYEEPEPQKERDRCLKANDPRLSNSS